MKKIFLGAAIALLSTVNSMAVSFEDADTIANITDATRLLITESASAVSVEVAKDAAGDSLSVVLNRSLDGDMVIKQKRWRTPFSVNKCGTCHSHWDLVVGGPTIGWVDAVDASPATDIEMGKSLEISWLNALAVSYMPWESSNLSFGFGFTWRNYRISTSATRFIPSDEGGVAFGPYPEGSIGHGSRLKVFSMGIPVIWRQLIPLRGFHGNRMSISVGAVFNYNSHGSMLCKWTESDGRKAVFKTNHIGQRRFSLDIIGAVRIAWGFNVYVRYSPQTVLRGPGQPQFKPFSTGIGWMF